MPDPGRPRLIAYDGSEDARNAVREAGRLQRGGPAIVVHVWQSLAELLLHSDVQSLTGPIREAAEEIDREDRRAAEELAADGASLASEAGFRPRPLIVEGPASAWRALLEAADTEDAVVVVVGTRGLSGVESALLGSVSTGVVQHSARPVLIVPPSSGRRDGPLLVAYDGSEAAGRAIDVAAALLEPRTAVVMTVWTTVRDAAAVAALGAPAGVIATAADRLDAEAEAEAREVAERGAALAGKAGLEAERSVEIGRGNVWATLCRAASERACAGVVVGSRGRSRMAALLGSVSRGVVHHSPAPVLVVPPKRGEAAENPQPDAGGTPMAPER